MNRATVGGGVLALLTTMALGSARATQPDPPSTESVPVSTAALAPLDGAWAQVARAGVSPTTRLHVYGSEADFLRPPILAPGPGPGSTGTEEERREHQERAVAARVEGGAVEVLGPPLSLHYLIGRTSHVARALVADGYFVRNVAGHTFCEVVRNVSTVPRRRIEITTPTESQRLDCAAKLTQARDPNFGGSRVVRVPDAAMSLRGTWERMD